MDHKYVQNEAITKHLIAALFQYYSHNGAIKKHRTKFN